MKSILMAIFIVISATASPQDNANTVIMDGCTLLIIAPY